MSIAEDRAYFPLGRGAWEALEVSAKKVRLFGRKLIKRPGSVAESVSHVSRTVQTMGYKLRKSGREFLPRPTKKRW